MILRGCSVEKGSALLLVLFTILLISSLIVSAVEYVQQDVDEYAVLNRRFRSRTLAQTGLAYALPPQVRNEDRALLEQGGKDSGKFRVVITSESARLNINVLLQNNHDYLLQALFRRWGLTSRQIDPAIAGLHHFTDQPSDSATPVATAAPTPTPPAAGTTPGTQNAGARFFRAFLSVQEMSLVPGFAPVMKQKTDWADYFTIYGDGKIDVNSVDQAMLELVTGVTSAQADQFIKYRWGRDGKPFTADDQIYRSLEQVRTNLGMTPQQFQLIQDQLALNSSVDRIESTGTVANFGSTITAIVNRSTVPAQILLWQEK
ncbi:MAG TPA: hypothetical protein VGD78_02710 [Chthoniobacterales bacterium]